LVRRAPRSPLFAYTTLFRSSLGSEHSIDIVHLVMKALPGEDSFRDIDFSRDTLRARWAAGLHDGQRALRHGSWLTPPPDHLGMRSEEHTSDLQSLAYLVSRL